MKILTDLKKNKTISAFTLSGFVKIYLEKTLNIGKALDLRRGDKTGRI